MRPVTVGMLVDLLSKLPRETPVWEAPWNGEKPMDRTEMIGPHEWCPLMVYEDQGDVRLFFYDGEASYSEFDGKWEPIFYAGAVWKRILGRDFFTQNI